MEGTAAPEWPALKALQGDGGIMTVGMSMDMQGPKAAQQAASAAKFKELVDNLEKEPIPSEFSTPEREAAKKEIVENFRKIAAGGSDDEIKAAWEKVRGNMQTLTLP
jgi:hypothetical protein